MLSAAVLTFWMAAPGVDGADGQRDEVVRSWRIGSFTVFTEAEPFRIAVHADGRPILAERARQRGSAFELRTSSGWQSVTRLRSARRENAPSARAGPLVLEAETASGASLHLTVRSVPERGALELRWDLSGREVLAVRDDFVTEDEERFHGVADSPWLPSDAPDREASPGGTRWLIASRGLTLGVRSPSGPPPLVFLPDPDSLRVQSTGSSLEMTLLAGDPRQTLPRTRPVTATGVPLAGNAAAPVTADATERGASPDFWIRLERLPGRWHQERLLEEIAERSLPVPALLVQEGDRGASLLEIDSVSGGLLATPRAWPVGKLPRRLVTGVDPWRDLATAFRRCVDDSMTGTPEWVSLPLHYLAWASDAAPPASPAPAPAEGPVPRASRGEFAARALVLAAMQPLLCLDREGGGSRQDGDAWLEVSDEAAGTIRRCFQLHAALAGLGRELAADETERRLPLWRRLFVEFPDDPVAWEARDQWLFGPDVLIAPVMAGGGVRRVAYFPAGVWFEAGGAARPRVVRGPHRALIDVPPGGIGLFERRDARWGVRRFLPATTASDSAEE